VLILIFRSEEMADKIAGYKKTKVTVKENYSISVKEILSLLGKETVKKRTTLKLSAGNTEIILPLDDSFVVEVTQEEEIDTDY
jgi:uncharacterized protein YbcI